MTMIKMIMIIDWLVLQLPWKVERKRDLDSSMMIYINQEKEDWDDDKKRRWKREMQVYQFVRWIDFPCEDKIIFTQPPLVSWHL